MQHRTYRKNYSPIKYEKDDIPDLFAAVRRDGMRRPTFLQEEEQDETAPTQAPRFRTLARDVQKTMRIHERSRGESALPHKTQRSPETKRRRQSDGASPWFALTSGMVVAGALVMMLAAVAPERVLPKGAIARMIDKTLTATVVFSGSH